MKQSETVGQASRLSSSAVRHRQASRLPYKLLLCLLLLSACASPRVVEVFDRTRLQEIDVVDQHLFEADRASRLRYEPRDLPADQQREEFYVRWRGAGVDLVKFEYRQVDKPITILEQTFTPNGATAKIFEIRGEDFHSGGPVSAWRVSLWSGGALVAERKSALW